MYLWVILAMKTADHESLKIFSHEAMDSLLHSSWRIVPYELEIPH